MRDSVFRIVAGVLFFGVILLFLWAGTHGVDIIPHGPWTLHHIAFLASQIAFFGCVGVYFVSPTVADRLVRRLLRLHALPGAALSRVGDATLGRIITDPEADGEKDGGGALPPETGGSGASGADGAGHGGDGP